MGIAADIQRELDRRGWKLYRLHKESGVLHQTLRSIMESDSNPGIDKVVKISRAFGITIDELVSNPKPLEKASSKTMSQKDLKQVLIQYGIRPDDVGLIMDVIRSAVRKSRLKEKGSGNGEAEEPVA